MTTRSSSLLPAALVFSAAVLAGAAWAQPSFSNAVSLGTVDIGELREASGVAASRNNDRVLWSFRPQRVAGYAE